ncbi:hypothetical protein BJ508DRAFT_377287 [Ascobolus immersus RN42]|uniref:BTB domain-containing protein n=1 Tax=Ascobolus immersus RN42 TaxID=1160509 RepID=A0A3N4I1S5_ASCIM|nr:hypothetical protein BJ508DRAFT_377287 [Ascobolus immersus RN42]
MMYQLYNGGTKYLESIDRSQPMHTPPDSRVGSPVSSDCDFEIDYFTPKSEVSDNRNIAIGRFFNSNEYSDMTVVCGDETFPAHRIVLCSQSEFFLDSMRSKKDETVVTISDEEPKTIYRLLRYLYTGDYPDHPRSKHPELDNGYEGTRLESYFHYSVNVNYEMYRLAAKFGVPGLAKRAVYKHERQLAEMPYVEERVWSCAVAYSRFPGQHDAMRMIHVPKLADPEFKYVWDDEAFSMADELRSLLHWEKSLDREYQAHCKWAKAHFENSKYRYRPRSFMPNGRHGWDLLMADSFADLISKEEAYEKGDKLTRKGLGPELASKKQKL